VHKRVEDVVRAGLAGIERNKPLVVPGAVMKIALVLLRLTPMAILRRV
jgi:short-subunit dehydrogenase